MIKCFLLYSTLPYGTVSITGIWPSCWATHWASVSALVFWVAWFSCKMDGYNRNQAVQTKDQTEDSFQGHAWSPARHCSWEGLQVAQMPILEATQIEKQNNGSKGVQVLIPRIWECVTFYSKRDFEDVIKATHLRSGDDPGSSPVGLI